MDRSTNQNHVLAFIVRLVLSAAVLWLAVAWAGGPAAQASNTFGRAVVVSLVLSAAYYLTLARFLWFLVVPWLLYVAVWLLVIQWNYGIGLGRALLLALALTFLSWVASALLGVKPLRAD
jgi:putative membrane protein